MQMNRCDTEKSRRKYLVGWLYLVAVGHVLVAIAMTLWGDAAVARDYHQQVLASFGLPADALALQHWWFKLFGATLQAFSLLMLLLVYAGNRYADPIIWLALALTILCWAPQDIYLSLQQSMWSHLWVDLGALLAIVPAALGLMVMDYRTHKNSIKTPHNKLQI
jgi:hypothetical protein